MVRKPALQQEVKDLKTLLQRSEDKLQKLREEKRERERAEKRIVQRATRDLVIELPDNQGPRTFPGDLQYFYHDGRLVIAAGLGDYLYGPRFEEEVAIYNTWQAVYYVEKENAA